MAIGPKDLLKNYSSYEQKRTEEILKIVEEYVDEKLKELFTPNINEPGNRICMRLPDNIGRISDKTIGLIEEAYRLVGWSQVVVSHSNGCDCVIALYV